MVKRFYHDLCANFKRSLIRVWLLGAPDWKCEIEEGSSGLVDVQWSSDSRCILSTGSFHLRITVWSLITKTISYIQHPKNCSKYMDFARNGKYLAVAERRGCKDFISIFNCSSWFSMSHFSPATDDLDGVSWSPTRDIFCVWESCLGYKVLVYSFEGQCLSSFSACDLAPGIKSVAWSPSGQILAIGSYDEKLRLLNHLTWGLVEEFQHNEALTDEVPMYKEVIETDNPLKGSSYHLVMSSRDFRLPVIKPEVPKANHEIGVGVILFSADSKYIASISHSMPSCIWIWSLSTLKCFSLIVREQPIRDFSWDPVRSRLALCTGSSEVLIWMPEGALSVPVPCKDGECFSVVRVKWWPVDGSRLALIGTEQMCWCSTMPEQCQVSYSPKAAS